MDYEKAYRGLMDDIDHAIAGSQYGHETRVVLENIKSRAENIMAKKRNTDSLLSEARKNMTIGYAKKLLEFGVSDECRSALEKEISELAKNEDEKLIETLIEIVNITPAAIAVNKRKELVGWLENHRMNNSIQWSEQDEEYHSRILSTLYSILNSGVIISRLGKLRCEKEVEWFRCLRYRIQNVSK